MKFLYNLIRAYRIATQELRYSEIYDLQGAWGEEDQRAAAAFFSNPVGSKLKARMTNMVFRAQAAACDPTAPYSAEFKTGVARGVAMTVNSLQEHFLIRAPSA